MDAKTKKYKAWKPALIEEEMQYGIKLEDTVHAFLYSLSTGKNEANGKG